MKRKQKCFVALKPPTVIVSCTNEVVLLIRHTIFYLANNSNDFKNFSGIFYSAKTKITMN